MPVDTTRRDEARRKHDPTYDLQCGVGDGRMDINQALRSLRLWVSQLNEEEREEWKRDAVSRARRLMQIAEAFQQELTVMAAGQ